MYIFRNLVCSSRPNKIFNNFQSYEASIFFVTDKIYVVAHASTSPSLRATALHFKVQTSHIRRWCKNIDKIEGKYEQRSGAYTTHGVAVVKKQSFKRICDYLTVQRGRELSMTTDVIVCFALSVNKTFKNVDQNI